MSDLAFFVIVFIILAIANLLAIIIGRKDREASARACGDYFDKDELMKRIEKLIESLKGDGGDGQT